MTFKEPSNQSQSVNIRELQLDFRDVRKDGLLTGDALASVLSEAVHWQFSTAATAAATAAATHAQPTAERQLSTLFTALKLITLGLLLQLKQPMGS